MVAALTHPSLLYEAYTTVLVRIGGHGLVLFDRWALSTDGLTTRSWPAHEGGVILLDVYYLMYIIAFGMALYIVTRAQKSGWLRVRPHVPYDAVLIAIAGTLLGAKLAYVFIYNPAVYFVEPETWGETFRRIFLNWSGMASHGAVAGIAIGLILWWRLAGAPALRFADLGGLAGASGAICIRFGNFMNGELYGRVANESLPWAMRFPAASPKGNSLFFWKGSWFEQVGTDEGWQLIPTAPLHQSVNFLHRAADGTLRFFSETSAIPAGLEAVPLRIVTSPRHPSQLYQLLLEGVLLFVVLLLLKRRVKRVGMLSSAFLVGYGVTRFLGEFFRQPDVQFGTAENPVGTVVGFLTMGQLLSLALIGAGIAVYFWAKKRNERLADLELWPPESAKPETVTSQSAPREPEEDPEAETEPEE